MLCRRSGPVTGPKYAPSGASYLAVLILALCCLAAAPTLAHEGHDEQPTAGPGAPASPRLAIRSELYELVAVLEGERLTIYLDRFDDNSPVTDANIAVAVNEEQVIAQPTGDGSYAVVSKRFSERGLVELVFDIKARDADDLLIGKLTLAGFAGGEGFPNAQPWYGRAWAYARRGAADHLMLVVLTLLAGLALWHVLLRRRLRELLVVVFAIQGLTAATAPRAAFAHDGGHEGDAKPAVSTGDTAKRLPNGQVFVPKPTQRILDIRTVIAKSETHPKVAVFTGRVTADPNRSGLVQSITGGRVTAPEGGLTRLGQAVAKGDLMALVEPPMALADRTTISERTGELEQMIAVAEAKLRRLRAMAERLVAPQSLVIETEAELEGLHRRRELVREARIAPEALRAPIGGVVAVARAVSGQVVQAQDLLFQIVDPDSLWVEAYDYGDNDPASLKLATAVGTANAPMKLVFQGWSRTLQQQATVLQFAIAAPPSWLRVGQPVTVTAQRSDTATGVIVDRDAIVRSGNGESIVWRHVEPELFEARSVRTEPFDGAHVLVAAGIGAGDRVVVRGAELINQIR